MSEKVQIGNATLHMGDCLEFMGSLGDDSVDAVVTDPPYCSGSIGEASRSAAKGQGLRSENISRFGWFVGDNMGTAGLVFLMRAIAFEAVRVMKPSGSFIAFCDWRMVANLAPAIESAGLRFQNLVVWDKASMGLGTGFRAQHEIILHFTNGKPEYHNKGTSNVLRCERVGTGDREHQTQKPVDLMRQILRVVCAPKGLVIDPFMGSGSTGVAAAMEGMSFAGSERDSEHFITACTRIQESTRQTGLFESAIAPAEQLSFDA